MTTITVEKDPEQLTLRLTVEYDAEVSRVWQLWADPRRLERWWGPPTYPATFDHHDLRPGGTVTYFMTGPEGERHRGWWRVVEVEEPTLLVVEDGFADEQGTPVDGLPVTVMRVTLAGRPRGGTVMTIASTFASIEDMERLIEMGVVEGMQGAMSQIDAILAES